MTNQHQERAVSSSQNILELVNGVNETINTKQLVLFSPIPSHAPVSQTELMLHKPLFCMPLQAQRIGRHGNAGGAKSRVWFSKTNNIVCAVSGGQDSVFLLFCLSFLQLQISLFLKIVWCNHFWQTGSFYTTLHLTKSALAFSYPILGFLSCQLNPSPFFYKNVVATYKRKRNSCISQKNIHKTEHLPAFTEPASAFYPSLPLHCSYLQSSTNRRFVRPAVFCLPVNGSPRFACHARAWGARGARGAWEGGRQDEGNGITGASGASKDGFRRHHGGISFVCLYPCGTHKQASVWRKGQNSVFLKGQKKRFLFPLLVQHSAFIQPFFSYKTVSKAKGSKRFREEKSETRARNWRHIAAERGCAFYSSKLCVYGHTASDRVETVLFNLIRGSKNKGIAILPWRRRQSDFSYNRFYTSSYKQFLRHLPLLCP